MKHRIFFFLVMYIVLSSTVTAQENNLFTVIHAVNKTQHTAGWVIVDMLGKTPTGTVLAGKNFPLSTPNSWVEPLIGFAVSKETSNLAIGFKLYWETKPWLHTWIESAFVDPLNAPGLGRESFLMLNMPISKFGKIGAEWVSGVGMSTFGGNVLVPCGDTFTLVGHFREGRVVSIDAFFSF